MTNAKTFYGYEISEYGQDAGRVDYATLSKAVGDMILCNDITKLFYSEINGEYREVELFNGSDYDEETDEYNEYFQYYIIDGAGADLLAELTTETVYYLPTLDLYIWAIDHWGTSWDYVLTDIDIKQLPA